MGGCEKSGPARQATNPNRRPKTGSWQSPRRKPQTENATNAAPTGNGRQPLPLKRHYLKENPSSPDARKALCIPRMTKTTTNKPRLNLRHPPSSQRRGFFMAVSAFRVGVKIVKTGIGSPSFSPMVRPGARGRDRPPFFSNLSNHRGAIAPREFLNFRHLIR